MRFCKYSDGVTRSAPSERKLQSELNEARVVDRGVDLAEASGVDVVDRRSVLRIVNKLKNSARKLRPISRGRANLLDRGGSR